MRWQNWNLKQKAAVLAYFKFLPRHWSEWPKTIAYKSNYDGRDLSWNTKPVHSEYKTTCFLLYVICLMTNPYPFPKGVIYRALFSAPSFHIQYPLFSLRLSGRCLRLLPRLPVTFLLPSILPSIMCYRRQFLCKVWPIQLAFLIIIACGRLLSRCVYNDIFTRNETKEKWNKKYLSHIRKLLVGCCSGNALHLHSVLSEIGARSEQLVEALHYKAEGRGSDSRWCHWNFPLT
jgi:hypothetical protein